MVKRAFRKCADVAFAVWMEQQKLMLARDRLGIKPLFLFVAGAGWRLVQS